ncbi:hypothetical protein PanWU01x14_040450 [Parasponia andersonii]|uniref:Uncharacterized protein n=1 Tax=Parasponia andersonii TaxID=3476 RepID=A0A2P5DR62_PARAD|nr:hypothetical protein PanWU01x14_040450 [Parasponia andersonii]
MYSVPTWYIKELSEVVVMMVTNTAAALMETRYLSKSFNNDELKKSLRMFQSIQDQSGWRCFAWEACRGPRTMGSTESWLDADRMFSAVRSVLVSGEGDG